MVKKSINKDKEDALGSALLDYVNGNYSEDIKVISNIAEDDIIPLNYLFRAFKQFPIIEKKALQLAKGKILDVGAGSGCHSLFLQDNNFDVLSIDTSIGAVKTMKKRGVKQPLNVDFYTLGNIKFDTILFLMNGVGIAKKLSNLNVFLSKAKSLLNKNGQILLDSSDIKYMFEEENDAILIDLNSKYYGEVTYQMQYKNFKTKPFNWLFVDFNTLKIEAEKLGLKAKLIKKGKHFDYLAQLIAL